MISWLRFEWSTAGVPEVGEEILPLVARPASKEQVAEVEKAISSAFSMDSTWGDATRLLDQKFSESIKSAFEGDEPSCVVLLHGQRIIGASVMNIAEDAQAHLLTGPCVLHEYRNRGLGTALLQASLVFLREHGIRTARGLTRKTSIAARFVYPKFGGTSAAVEGDPLKAQEA